MRLGPSFTPVRGNTYYVADGSYGSKTFNTAASGSQLITIKKATVASHGPNTGWVDTLGDGQATWGSQIQVTTSNWVIDGVSRSTPTSGHGFVVDNTASTTTELFRIGAAGGAGVSNITVKYLELRGRGYGQATVFDRGFYGINTGTSNITIQYCYAHSMYVPVLTRFMDTVLFEHNYTANNNSRPEFHAEFWSDSGSDDVTIRYNQIENNEGTTTIFQGNGTGTTPNDSNTATNWQIYGNVCFYRNYNPAPGNNPGTNGFIWIANDAGNKNWSDGWLVYNNTLYDYSYGGDLGARIFNELPGSFAVPMVRNNFFDSCADGAVHTNVNSDYNYYRNTTHTAEANQQLGTVSLLTSPATANFRLTAGTVSGLTLAAPFTQDMDGVTRTPGSWDRGAFEFAGGAGDTTPPTLSSSVIGATGLTMTRTFSEPVSTGAGDNADWAISLSGGAITGTYASGNGTAAILYNLSRTVGATETGTNSYTQPGDGVEDASLNDLATLSGAVILNNSTVQQVATPVMSPVTGPYFGTQNVTLTSSTPGATIRYTTDGSDPTASSTLYVTPILVPVSTTIKAKAFASGFTESNISTAAYEVGIWAGTLAWKTFAVPQQTGFIHMDIPG